MKRILHVLGAVILLAVSAQVDLPVPGSPVPQSVQTLAVLLVGLTLGARDAAAALSAYLLAGGLGLPVFAGGSSGWVHLAGPTAGYLLGFLAAATGVGLQADRGRIRAFIPALVVMTGAHLVILGLGWLRLALDIGFAAGFAQGVVPFLWGGLLKSALAAGVAVWWLKRERRVPT